MFDQQDPRLEDVSLTLRMVVALVLVIGTAMLLAWLMSLVFPSHWIWGGDGCPAETSMCGYPPLGLTIAMVSSIFVLYGVGRAIQSIKGAIST